MPHSSFLRPLFPALLALSLFVMCGCTKSSRGTGLDNVAYTKSHTVVRIEPAPTARAVVSAGPNVRVTVLETKHAFSRISMDEGRVTGWVATSDLSDTPVTERAVSRSATKSPPKTPRPAASAAQPATGDSSAPEQAPGTAAPAQAAEPAASPQAPQAATDSGSDGLLSPRSAQAAPPPAEPTPAATSPPPSRAKQANPDAFDPF
jgi:hypothetical protein